MPILATPLNIRRCLPAAAPPTPLTLAPAVTLWGHTARVWDAALLGNLAATAGEDCSARLWDVASGRCLAVLQV